MIDKILHPEYALNQQDWHMYGLAHRGTYQFVEQYLRKLSDKESDADWTARKRTAYIPRYAASAVTEVKNSILQRLSDVQRSGGSATYQRVVTGDDKGVDYQNKDMTTFMGDTVLMDLLVYGKAGVLVDNFTNIGETDQDQTGHPYVRLYSAPDIRSWTITDIDKGFDSLLLSEEEETYQHGLVDGVRTQYRLYTREPGVGVRVEVYGKNRDHNPRDPNSLAYIADPNKEVIIPIDRIPFTVLQIQCSLMTDIARMQAELMNMESSDVSHVLYANFPFLAAAYDEDDPSPYRQNNGVDENGNPIDGPIQEQVGSRHGKLFSKETPYPKYIAPPVDNLKASIEKGEQIKNMIRSMLHLNLQALTVTRQSKESKEKDNDSMEAGLSVIAKVLEQGEMSIAQDWQMFDKSGDEPKVIYPKKFNLLSTSQRLDNAKQAIDVASQLPSITCRRQVYKTVVASLYGTEFPLDVLEQVYRELDEGVTLTSIGEQLAAIEAGAVQHQTIASYHGFAGDEAEKAKEARLDFVEATLKAQGGEVTEARGVPEMDDDTGSAEKINKKKRGEEDV